MTYTDPTGHCADGIVNPIHFLHSPCELGGPEAAAETEMASVVENAAITAQAETAATEAATPLANAVNATDGAVVYDAPAPSGIGESGIAGETTTTIGVNPSSINFSQRSVSENVNQYTNDMVNGKWDWSKSGPARVINRNGQWVTYDNRSVMAAQDAGLEKIPVEVVSPEDFMPGSKRTWGQAFTRRFNDPRNIELGGPVPLQGLSQQPIVSPRGPR